MSSSRSQSRQRPEQINSGFTAVELAAIDERRGPFSRAGWLRNAALVAIDLPPERPGRLGLPKEDVAAVAALAGSVGRTAGATVQLAKALRLSGHVGFCDLVERVVMDLRRQSGDITLIIEKLK